MVEPDVIVEPMHGTLAASGLERRRLGRVEFTSAELISLLRKQAAADVAYLEIVRDDDDTAAARGIGMSVIFSALLVATILLAVFVA